MNKIKIAFSVITLGIMACVCDSTVPAATPPGNTSVQTIIAATFAAAQQSTQAVAAPVSAATSTSVPVPTSTPAPVTSQITKVGEIVTQAGYELTVTNIE